MRIKYLNKGEAVMKKQVKNTQASNKKAKTTKVNNEQVKNRQEKYKIVHHDRGELIRLNKYISETGICSRREADKLIESGRVTINGIVAEMGTKVKENTDVKVDGKSIKKSRFENLLVKHCGMNFNRTLNERDIKFIK